jgi:hypothetical protein
MIRRIDCNGSGRVSYEEFAEFISTPHTQPFQREGLFSRSTGVIKGRPDPTYRCGINDNRAVLHEAEEKVLVRSLR